MFLAHLACLVVVLGLAVNCSALPGIRPERTPSIARRGLKPRQVLESINIGLNFSTTDATIVPLMLSSDRQSYFVDISVGPAQFRAALDTGSADLWLVSSACNTASCNSLPRYQLGYKSPTFASVNANSTAFNISFADTTSASGFVAVESVQISNLTVADQAFGVVTTSNVTFVDQISGIIGFGFPRLSTISDTVANAPPFFATMAQQGLLSYPLFGIHLPQNLSETGSLSFGGIDASIVANRSLIEWNEVVPFAPFGSTSNVSSYLQWAIKLSGISVNGTQLTPLPTYPNATNNASLAFLDVGTPGIFGPYQDVERIFSLIPDSRLADEQTWALPCNINQTLSFQFGNQNFTMQPSDFLIGPLSSDPNFCLSWPRASPPSPDGLDWQFGQVFLRTVYSIFSYGINTKESPMIGLYPLNNSTDPVETPEELQSYFSAVSTVVPTTLPNFFLSTPTFTTPPYTFNASVTAPAGEIVASGLATSTYSPVLETHHLNASAISFLSPSPTLFTFILTDPSGQISTSVSTATQPTVTLGEPPGWSSGAVSVRLYAGTLLATSLALFCGVAIVVLDIL